MSYKFQEANGWIDTGYADSKSQEYLNEGNLPLKLNRGTDFSAPKFKTSGDHYRILSYYNTHGAQNLGPAPTSDTSEDIKNSRILKEKGSPNHEIAKGKKTTLNVQMCPSVNIQRELMAQNLEDIHISPDPSFVQECTNVGTYTVHQDFSARNGSPTRKEKVVKIVDKNDNVKNSRNRRPDGGKQRKRIVKEFNKGDNNVDTKQVSGLAEKSGISEASNNCLVEIEKSVEDLEKVETRRNFDPKDEGNLESTVLSDTSGSHDRRSQEDQSLSVHSITNINQETEILKERPNDSTTNVASETKNKVQLRFTEVMQKTEQKEIREVPQNSGEMMLQQNLKTQSKSVQFEIPNVADNNIHHLKSPLLSKETETCFDNILQVNKVAKEKKKRKREEKVQENEKEKKNEGYKIIDERFSSVLKKYCDQTEETSKTDGHFVSSSVDSSGDSEDSEDLDNLYKPSINKLDNVLLAYDKVINNVARSTKTIDKFLSRPEVEEYLVHDTTAETESSASTPLNEGKVEAKRRRGEENLYYSQTKRNIEVRTRDSILKTRSSMNHKNINKDCHPCKATQTKAAKTVKPVPIKKSIYVKENNCPRKKYIPVSPEKHPRHDLKTQRQYGALKKLPNKEWSEDSAVLEEPHTRESRFQNDNDSSGLTTFSINTLSSSPDTGMQNINNIKMLETNEATNLKSILTQDLQNIEKKNFEDSCDYATLYNMVHSDILKHGISKSEPTPVIVEHLIARVLQEETRLIEDKIKNAFNSNQIVPALVKSLLENLQPDACNLKALNSELLIPENDTASGDVQTIEAVVKFGSVSKERNLQIERSARDENCNATESKKSDEQIGEEEIFISNQEVFPESTDNSKSLSSMNKEHASRSKSDRTSKINSDTELIKEISDKTNDEDKETNVHLIIKESDNENLSSAKSTGVSQRLANEENRVAEAVKNDTEQNANRLINLHAKEAVSEVADKSLTMAKSEEVKSSLLKSSTNSSENLLPSKETREKIPEAREEKLPEADEKLIELHSIQGETKTSRLQDNVHQISSSDSLRDCASLRSSPREHSKRLSIGEPSGEADGTERLPVTEMTDGEVTGVRDKEDSFRDGIFNRKKILSELYEDINKKLLCSTLNTNSAADRNFR